jgi:RHS repeat-associated protein
LTQKTYPDTTTVNYTYDNDSRLTQVSDPTGTYSFTFDNMGRLTNTSTQYSFLTSRSFTTAYSYDAASNRTGFTDPESGSSTYAYDTLNRLQTLTPPSAISSGNFGFGYDALSRRTSLTRPNSVNTAYSYDNLSRLLSVTHAKSGTTLDGASYAVDNAGNRTSRTPLPSGTASNFTYDSIYELTQVAQGLSTTESYSFDPVGNRLSSLGVSSYTNNSSNELTSTSNATYTYDNNGNTLTKVVGSNTTQYFWDYENRMSSVTLPGSGGTVSFKYDPFGRRIYKSSSSGTSVYAYDGDNLVEETNSSGTAVARYEQGLNIDEPLAMLRSSTTSYYEADGLGSITSLSSTAGALAQTYTFDSFGNQTASSGSLTNPFQYTARESDPETGLYYYRARYYDSSSGRFLSEDPMGFYSGIDFYQFVENNPGTYTDPSGLCPANVVSYIKDMCKYAKGIGGPDCETKIALIQSGFESGWGAGPFVPDNNYFGLHGRGDKSPYSHPAKKNKNAIMPIFSSPAAGFNEYKNRLDKADISYRNDLQFMSDVTFKLSFAVPDSKDPAVILKAQKKYINDILKMVGECALALDGCTKGR